MGGVEYEIFNMNEVMSDKNKSKYYLNLFL